MKVVFLDIDGVMVTGETVTKRAQVEGHGFNLFAKEPVAQLNRILEATGAEIVVSSSWRCDGPRWDALLFHFTEQGVSRRPVGRTPQLERRLPSGLYAGAQRGDEIKAWLSNDVESFVAIDDDSDMDAILPRFVHVKNGMWRGGLGPAHADQAIEILGPRL